MTDEGNQEGVSNLISGGRFAGPVIQAGHVSMKMPTQQLPALSAMPPVTTAFTGRDRELSLVLKSLAWESVPTGRPKTIVITGLSGIGKTELCNQAARIALEKGWFPGGILFVDLLGYEPERRRSPDGVTETLLMAIGVSPESIPAAAEDRVRLLHSILASYASKGQRVLVVLDNAFSADQVQQLIPTDGSTCAIITSRHKLASLDASLITLEVLSPDGAIDLLERVILDSCGSDDSRVREDRGSAALLGELCGYLPLALRIVGALLAEDPTRTAESLARDLEDTKNRLDELQYEDKSVRAAFDLSYGNLDDADARLFRLLPLDVGAGTSLESAAILNGESERVSRKAMERLMRAHLVGRGAGYGRWRLHDLVRIYADQEGDKHSVEDDRDAALNRLLDHYLTTMQMANAVISNSLEPCEDEHRFADQEEASLWLDSELSNLINAASSYWSVRPDFTVNSALLLSDYLLSRRYLDEWFLISHIALLIAQMFEDKHSAGSLLLGISTLFRERRDSEKAIEVARGAVATFSEIGDDFGKVRALNILGLALQQDGELAEAISTLREASLICRELQDDHGEAATLCNLCIPLRRNGDLEEAISAGERAVEIFTRLGDRRGVGSTLSSLGSALGEIGRFEDAVDACQKAVVILEEIDRRHDYAMALNNLGVAQACMAQFPESITTCKKAAGLFVELGDKYNEALAQLAYGSSLVRIEAYAESIEPLERAAELLSEAGDLPQEARTLLLLGEALCELSRSDEGVRKLTRAAGLYSELGMRYMEAFTLGALGSYLCSQGDYEEAISASGKASDLFLEEGDREALIIALSDLHRAYSLSGDETKATEVLSRINSMPPRQEGE